ncbi:Uncharacterised protein [BD1-7 clade bacterium]|uniref:Uncharacterized protein n=1 Tax=BD1-7 clade bacterium TaxID=2029982 RepID=A0A5S9MZ84_9GAMM|nr:Uncharacterised protein [BD1-7 clade bacterium]
MFYLSGCGKPQTPGKFKAAHISGMLVNMQAVLVVAKAGFLPHEW